ncbi:MAG: lipopolysaccharide heptosyltransferase II [Candidatus Omnitrophica bacterium]|nr:lipopolysaccharide heptosyltransferase II [Candidatus Omnitrophota bacterium]
MSKEINPKKILIVRTDRLGDVILSTPVIKNLKMTFPGAHIAFMCRPYTEDVLRGNPYLDEIIVYDKNVRHKNLWASIKFSLELKKKNFDWAIILHPTVRAHVITFFARIPFRIGWDKKRGWLLTKRLPHTKQEGFKHESEYTLDILRSMDVAVTDNAPYFPIQQASEHKVEEILARHGVHKKEEFIVVHPCASCPSKRWPQEYFAELVKILRTETRLKVVIIASGEEKKFGDTILETNEVVDLRGMLSISEIGSLLKRAALFISNDSGPVHIAAALHIPVISIFGRNDPGLSPQRWRPLGETSFYFHKKVGCSVCLAHNCTKGFLCLRAITPQEVAQKAIQIIYDQ